MIVRLSGAIFFGAALFVAFFDIHFISNSQQLFFLLLIQLCLISVSVSFRQIDLNNIFLAGFVFYMMLLPSLFLFGFIPANFLPYSYELIIFSQQISTVALVCYLLSRKLHKKAFTKAFVNNEVSQAFSMRFLFIFSIVTIILIFALDMPLSYYFIKANLIIFLAWHASDNKTIATQRHFVSLFLIINVFAFLLFADSRRDFLEICLIGLVFYSLVLNKVLNLKIVFLGVTIGIVGILYISIFGRSSLGIFDTIKTFSAYISDDAGRGFFGWLLMMMDFSVAYENYLFLLKNIEQIGTIDLQSFQRMVSFFIPRDIWYDKPMGTQILIVESRKTLGSFAGGTSQSMTLIGDLYWNAKIPAVCFGFILLGFIISTLENMIIRSRGIKLALALSFVPMVFIFWRGGFSTTFVYGLIGIAIFCITMISYMATHFLLRNIQPN